MRRLRILLLILLLGVAALSFAGDVQVLCEPALRVFLDGKFVGMSNARQDGLFLPDVRSGGHVIRVEKDGFAPQNFQVMVEKLPIEVTVGQFLPATGAFQEQAPTVPSTAQATGTLVVLSAPQNCNIEIDGKLQAKTTPVLRVEGLAPGEHRISFIRPGYNQISGRVWMDSGGDVTVRGDLETGSVEIVKRGTGSLRLVSTPQHCQVLFLGKTYDKTFGKLNLSYLPSGKHRIVVSMPGRRFSTEIMIISGHRTVISVNMLGAADPFVISYEPE